MASNNAINSPNTSGTVLTGTGGASYNATAYSATGGTSNIVSRDSNGNTRSNNSGSLATAVTSAGSTTVLTAASTKYQVLQGSLAQTFQLPDATTLYIGARFEFNNNSTGILTVTNAATTPLCTVPAGGAVILITIATSTSAGAWDIHYEMPSNAQYGTSGLTVTGTITGTTSISSPQILATGASSGTVSILPQAAAGTYNFNLPITAGTSGYFLTSAGGGSSPMTWTSITGAGAITSINGNSGTATPSSGVVTITTGASNTNGTSTLTGSSATLTLSFSDASSNVGIGSNSIALGTGNSSCIALGNNTLMNAVSSAKTVAIGHEAMKAFNGATKWDNTIIGYRSGTNLLTGVQNTFVGSATGFAYTTSESNNILIGYNVQGTIAESNVIRIGNTSNTSCYITGIDGVNVGSVAKVVTETSNQLGTATITGGTGITVTPTANTITITGTGVMTVTPVTHAATPYTVLNTDQFLAVNVSAGVVTLRLPNAPTTGKIYNIKDSNGLAATSNISVTTVGGTVTIDGQTTYTMATNYQSINVIFDGSNYEVY